MLQAALLLVTKNELHVQRLKQTSAQYLKVRLCSKNTEKLNYNLH